MYLRGKKQEFITNASKIQQLLDITNPEYVSKDAFPLPQEIIDGIHKSAIYDADPTMQGDR